MANALDAFERVFGAAMGTHDDVFKIDEECSSETGGRSPSPDSKAGSEKPHLDMPCPSSGANEDIELSRRAVPVVQLDDDVCSICLDEFTAEDPEQHTACEHRYHLQCIMQWAQRSRECPMCFKTLQLKDEALNELLPFGEYVPPERMTASAPQFVMGLDSWELEQLLQRLAVVNGPGAASSRRDRRRHRRHSHHTHASSSSVIGNTNGGVHDSGHVKMNGRSSIEQPASSSREQGDSSSSSIMPEEADMHPSSWPPPSQRNLMSHAEGRMQQGAERHTGMADGLQGLRSRLSGIKDSFSSIKSRWSGQRSSQDHSRPPAPSALATPSVSHPQQRAPSS